MTINRNDKCPCGSGKKYKKCCLKKENVIQLETVKLERFLQQKHHLVEKLRFFLEKNISINEFYRKEAEFNKRSARRTTAIGFGFFQFWFYFFHRFDNGLRGIEWFYKENQHKLATDEKILAENWVNLKPRIVQAIDRKGDDIFFEDVLTKETFAVPNVKENIPYFSPWYGTIGLLEQMGDRFYFNGVRAFEGPEAVYRIAEKVKKLMNESGSSSEHVLFNYFPEMLADLLGNDDIRETKIIHYYTLKYDIQNEQVLIDFLYNQKEVEFDKWDANEKRVSWVKDWKVFHDSEINGAVHFAEVEGAISVENNHMEIHCYKAEAKEKIKKKMEEINMAVTFLKEDVKETTVPFHIEIQNLLLNMEEDVPRYAAIYAQNSCNLDVNVKILKFGDYTIGQLIAMNRKEDVDIWLKQMEYHLYQTVYKEFGEVEVTADFNTIRKQLGLSLSPFVSGQAERKSSLQSTIPQNARPIRLKNEDIPYFEDLGFTPDTIDNFYAVDMVTFFKEKTKGKSSNTVRKYGSSLFDLRYLLEMKSFDDWGQCDKRFWTKVLTKDLFNLYEFVSKTQLKEFISTIKAFTKWLDKKYNTTIAQHVSEVIEKNEEKMFELVGY
ncbi:SEC-C metal-binding domain-containing protein [Niallia sp. 03190]|uniref:SEC-C metal-binding domain-containing protein n=1 Tax=Niallia sp. 03190 TaxID=3458061 RepID=UPI004044E54A